MTLAEDHLGLAFHIARRYHAPDEEAVTGEALAALARAEREFDPARGRFPAFAGRLIERACLAETLRQRGRGTEVPLTIPIPGEDGEERERPELAHHPRETDRLLGLQAAALLARLPERQRRILVLRFGLEDGQERTQREVAAAMGLTRTRVSQLEAPALARLRQLVQKTRANRRGGPP
ncbi:MAG: RNA polymerase sigma-35 factor [Thermoanaerobaculia bacterium]|nr:RNA polymerase sigma-35 factor [Thermoanaerobaculia bacterium]